MENLIYKILKENYNISKENILGIYEYGSRLYGSNNENSDYDFLIITNYKDIYYDIYESKKIDIHIISEENLIDLINECNDMFLAMFFNKNPIKKYNFNLLINDIDKIKLRKFISKKVNNSYVKAKKKLNLHNEILISAKSLFHSLRLIYWATFIAKNDKRAYEFPYYISLDEILKDYKNCNFEWDCINKKYKPIFNNLMSEFRKVAPKKV